MLKELLDITKLFFSADDLQLVGKDPEWKRDYTTEKILNKIVDTKISDLTIAEIVNEFIQNHSIGHSELKDQTLVLEVLRQTRPDALGPLLEMRMNSLLSCLQEFLNNPKIEHHEKVDLANQLLLATKNAYNEYYDKLMEIIRASPVKKEFIFKKQINSN